MERAIGHISQIPPGEGRNFALGGVLDDLRIAVFHTRDGQVHAMQADCPHRGGPLADGLTDDHAVVCPLHDRAYAFATGAGIGHECSVRVYAARLASDGAIMLATDAAGRVVARTEGAPPRLASA